MPSLSAFAVLALPLIALGAPQQGVAHRRAGKASRAAPLALREHYAGKDILEWDYFSEADPTHGNVNYQTKQNAATKGLAFLNSDGFAVLKVDNTSVLHPGEFRDSYAHRVRISSPEKFTKGLFIADIQAMPHGPTTWPAYWSVGDNWPANGEIDVLEGVNDATTNQMTLHTAAGCTLDNSPAALETFTGTPQGSTICESPGENNSGCGIVDSAPNAYGADFNAIGGGIFAHLVDDSGIQIWRFPRGSVPADITAQQADPAEWGKPAAFFGASTCDVASHFKDHVLVFDTTLCGDLAGNVFPGGKQACEAAIADPNNYQNAEWIVNSIDVYDL
ncbi:GH16 domain-containing protein [Mycena kentingensis (nom. inval.)]|nr:GH16 domain-containing protein [Mycena kentingensis (nom. inval.)]